VHHLLRWKIRPTGQLGSRELLQPLFSKYPAHSQAATLQTNVSVTWTTDKQGQPEMVAIITNTIACRARPHEYGFRMSIEQSFRDDKSGGFDRQHTRLRHVERLDHLLLAMAIATLWCHELGEFVLKQGDDSRCQIDPANQRTLSLFQLGLRWLKRSLATGLYGLPDFQATLSNLKLQFRITCYRTCRKRVLMAN
jgi:hypothetical protein